jgi:hypothetical protein
MYIIFILYFIISYIIFILYLINYLFYYLFLLFILFILLIYINIYIAVDLTKSFGRDINLYKTVHNHYPFPLIQSQEQKIEAKWALSSLWSGLPLMDIM